MKVFGIIGWKNTGKTTLTERLVRHLTEDGLTVSTIKHTHHGVDLDTPGTDSHRHRVAGASEVLLAAGSRWALMHESAVEPPLDALLARLAPVDLILVEGFKEADHPRLEVYRSGTAQPPIRSTDPTIVAMASDCALPEFECPCFDLDAIDEIAMFIRQTVRLP